MNKPTAYLMAGLPASGKSTYAAKLREKNPGAAYICPDICREQLTGDMSDQSQNKRIFDQILPALIQKAAAEGRDIIFDATLTMEWSRARQLEPLKALGYRVELHVFKTPLTVCLERNEKRDRKVPVDVLHRMGRQWEEPTTEEGFDEIILVQNIL